MYEVTIAIASYNVGQYIEQCLVSVLNQDFEELEILICDDCSTDNTLEIAERVSNGHPKANHVRIIRGEKNMGTAAIRNIGIDNAKGKYLLFLDGDDYLPKDAVSVLYKQMQETQADLVMGNHTKFEDGVAFSSDNKPLLTYGPFYKSELIDCPYALAEWMRRINSDYYPVALWNKLFKKSFLLQNQIRCIPSHKIIDDIYFAFQTIIKVHSVAVVDKVTLYFRNRAGSATHIDVREDRMEIYMDIFDQIINDIEKLKKQRDVIPIQLYYVLTNRYLSGFVIKNILNSKLLSTIQKKEFLNHISIITRMGLRRNDMIGPFNKVCFTALSSRYRYLLMKMVFWLRKKNII